MHPDTGFLGLEPSFTAIFLEPGGDHIDLMAHFDEAASHLVGKFYSGHHWDIEVLMKIDNSS